ncbi:hypothetical protein HMPREF1554_00954 [Porphyromonas gingivalis F0569]|nr:hypothetical protein HMPREF1554_00954 [Porphyromonas gingivalis F0569]ERJ68275.1 hypothetical protein HMPREF1553_01115 [Porphyromonas gingivalis F0568]OWR77499.1 hypothetical protein SJDPG11_01600 [Porphyromonas gingivalis SJD11]OWR78918.1 hypothetical protein SJDPG4_00710 [Porphyromonas gingivalis SJD4]
MLIDEKIKPIIERQRPETKANFLVSGLPIRFPSLLEYRRNTDQN